MADPDYFTLAEFRDLPKMNDEQTYPDSRVEAVAAELTAIVEREVGAPFVPRSVTQTLDGSGDVVLMLSSTHVRSITSVAVGGVSVDAGDLSAQYGLLRYANGASVWTSGVGNIAVTYVAGEYDECPADIKEPLMWATRDKLLQQSKNAGTVDVRRTSIVNDGATTNFVLPGEKRPTGYPDLDAAIAGRQRSDRVGGFA